MTEFSTTATEIPASDRGAFSFDHLGGYQRIGARSGRHVIIVSIGGTCEASQNETVIRSMAKGDRSWGYDRIAGALANLGHELPDQTVANVLRRCGIPPAPQRRREIAGISVHPTSGGRSKFPRSGDSLASPQEVDRAAIQLLAIDLETHGIRKLSSSGTDCGRDAHYWTPPAQRRTCGFPHSAPILGA